MNLASHPRGTSIQRLSIKLKNKHKTPDHPVNKRKMNWTENSFDSDYLRSCQSDVACYLLPLALKLMKHPILNNFQMYLILLYFISFIFFLSRVSLCSSDWLQRQQASLLPPGAGITGMCHHFLKDGVSQSLALITDKSQGSYSCRSPLRCTHLPVEAVDGDMMGRMSHIQYHQAERGPVQVSLQKAQPHQPRALP